MSAWSSYARVLLLGSRQVTLPDSGGSEAADPNVEERVLDALAEHVQFRRCGALPERLTARESGVAVDDERRRVGHSAAAILAELLAGDRHPGLLEEWLRLAVAAKRLPPPRALPQLLDLGGREPSLRPLLTDVVGKRGRWLAGHRRVWRYAAAAAIDDVEDTIRWEERTHEQRLVWLWRLRIREPEAARQRIEEALPHERARERSQLLEVLAAQLSEADEPLLEARLDDRGKEARAVAAQLLARLPTSRLCQRMRERAQRLLQWRPDAALAEQWLVLPPAALDPAAKRDGVEEKARTGWGRRASWCAQILARVPPALWGEQWGQAPEDFVRAAAAGEWAELLLTSWSEATLRHSDHRWARALVDTPAAAEHGLPLAELWALIPAHEREQRFESQLKSARPAALDGLLLVIAEAHGGRFTPAFTVAIARAIRRLVDAEAANWSYVLDRGLDALARRMDPALEERVAHILSDRLASDAAWGDVAHDTLDTLSFRRRMHVAIQRGDD